MVEKPKPLSKKKNKSIDLEPTLKNPEEQKPVFEAQLTTSEVDWLINHGLGHKDKITFYRRAIQDPKGSIQNPTYRPYVGEIAARLFDIIWSDNQMYSRLKTLLQMKYHGDVDNDRYVYEDEEEDDPEDDKKKKDGEEEEQNESVSFSRISNMLRKGK